MKLYAKAVWEGIEYNSVEDCEIYEIETGYSVRSLITGTYNNIFYKVAYQINTSRSWVLTSFEVKSEINGKILIIHAHKDPAGKWIFPQEPPGEVEGCIDIDISLTPFTNTLPINRLALMEGNEQKIKFLYIDILHQEIKPVYQKYKRVGRDIYKYENVPNDFEAFLTVDESGLVVTYPTLFKRVYGYE